MRFGVVVPTYNRESLVLETLESVAAQSRPADRVVIVDDCSTDDTVARVQAWIDRQSGPTDWMVVRRDENGGVSAARNSGTQHATDCDLLAFLDSDDLWPPDFIERNVSAAKRTPDAVAFVSGRTVEDSSRDRPPWIQRYEWIVEKPVSRMIRRGCPGPSCLVVRRQAMESVGGWDETASYMEDFLALADLSVIGPIAHVPGALVRYRLGIAQARGEQASTCHTHVDHGLHRATALDQFKFNHDYPGLRRERAFCWYRAARTAYRKRNWIECERRAARALRIAPWYPRPAFVWTRARFRRLIQSGSARSPQQLDA